MHQTLRSPKEGAKEIPPFSEDPVEHSLPEEYGRLESRVHKPTPVLSFPNKSTHHIHTQISTDCGHGGHREVGPLVPSQIRPPGRFLHFFREDLKKKSFPNKQLLLLPNPIFNVLTKMGFNDAMQPALQITFISYYPLAQPEKKCHYSYFQNIFKLCLK